MKQTTTLRINYGTGAGNEYITRDTFEEALEAAKTVADEGACYTQESIAIETEDGVIVSVRNWYGVPYDEEDYEEDADVIPFGKFGHYAPWYDWDI